MARVIPADRAGDVGRSDRTRGGARSPRVREGDPQRGTSAGDPRDEGVNRIKGIPWAEVEAELLKDPGFRELVAQNALGSVTSLGVLVYRTDRGLSQTGLAKELGLKQPAVSRLEIGEVNPSIETLRRLSAVLGMEFLISIAPTDQPRLLGKEIERASFTERIDSKGSHIVVGVVVPEAPKAKTT